MKLNWKKFLEAVEADPKCFAFAVINYLKPPNYAVTRLRPLSNLCYKPDCWEHSIDVCFVCGAKVCPAHLHLITGEGIQYEWYACDECYLASTPEKLLEAAVQKESELNENM